MQLHYFYCSLIFFFLLNTNFFVLLSIFKPFIKVSCHWLLMKKCTKAGRLKPQIWRLCIFRDVYYILAWELSIAQVQLVSPFISTWFVNYDLRYFVQMICLSDILCVCQYGESGNDSLVLKTKLPFLKTKVFFKRLFIHLKKLSF